MRPVAVLPLRRLFLARCGWLGKGWDVRMGRAVVILLCWADGIDECFTPPVS